MLFILINTSSRRPHEKYRFPRDSSLRFYSSYFPACPFVKMSPWLTRRVKQSKTRHFCQQRTSKRTGERRWNPSQRPRIMLNALTEPRRAHPEETLVPHKPMGTSRQKRSINSRQGSECAEIHRFWHFLKLFVDIEI
jgi:hypothetical protein